MSDALSCLQYLAENAPAWIKSLDELQSRIQGSHAELARVAVPVAPKVKKTSSNESLRHTHSRPDTSTPSTGIELTSSPQPYNSLQTTITVDQTTTTTPGRKRKTLSLLSAASGIHKYRSRAAITVYYDSEVQDVFDRIVRNISTGRNNIRKSRMADRAASIAGLHNTANHAGAAGNRGGLQGRVPMLRTVRSASGMPRFNTFIEENLGSPRGLGGLRPPPMSQLNSAEVKSDIAVKRTDAREEVDAALDKAQGFCEKGAHQFLRDGDCGEELAGAKAAFEEVIKISVEEVEKLKKEAEAAAAAAAAAAAEKAKSASIETEGKEEQDKNEKEMGKSRIQRTSISQHPALMDAAGLIEADDDDDSDIDYDDPSLLPSPPFRLMART